MVTTLIYTLHWHIAAGPPGTLAPMSEHFVVFTFFSQENCLQVGFDASWKREKVAVVHIGQPVAPGQKKQKISATLFGTKMLLRLPLNVKEEAAGALQRSKPQTSSAWFSVACCHLPV